MSALAAIAMFGLSGAQTYPIADVLSTARDGCEAALADNDAGQALQAIGWTSVAPTAGSWVAAELEKEAEFWRRVPNYAPSRIYAIKVADQLIVAFVNTITLKDGDLKVCSIEDRNAEVEGAGKILEWAGRKPTNPVLLQPDLQLEFEKFHVSKAWKPGLHASADSTIIRYMAPKNGGTGLLFASERLVKKEVP